MFHMEHAMVMQFSRVSYIFSLGVLHRACRGDGEVFLSVLHFKGEGLQHVPPSAPPGPQSQSLPELWGGRLGLGPRRGCRGRRGG